MGMSGASTKEINVTPLIDVLLVLLIIFLVLTPIAMRMMPVEMPRDVDGHPMDPPFVIKLNADLSVSFENGPTVLAADLPATLRARKGRASGLFVEISDGVPWAEVLGTVDTIRGVDENLPIAVRLRWTYAPE